MTCVDVSGRDNAFSSWLSMMRRCYITSEQCHRHYGARGITVCERWFDWRNFLADMGPRPDGTSLDRINNDGPYSPDNCRWANATTQNRNTRRNVTVQVNGQPMLAVDAAAALGVPESTLSRRRRRGASLTERTPLKLTRDQVVAIRVGLSSGRSCSDLGREFQVSRQHIANIRDGHCWGGQ